MNHRKSSKLFFVFLAPLLIGIFVEAKNLEPFADSVLSSSKIPEVPYGVDTENGQCTKTPDSPLFQHPVGSEPLEIALMTNYEGLKASTQDHRKRRGKFDKRHTFKESQLYYPGVLRVSPQNSPEEFHAVVTHIRGYSRSAHKCSDAPPLKIFFLNQTVNDSIIAALQSQNINPSHEDYLELYHNELVKIVDLPSEKAKSPTNGIFSGIGSELKLVTHCYAQSGLEDKGHMEIFEKKFQEAVLREFALYEMLAPLQWPVERVRLLNVSYFNQWGVPIYHKKNQVNSIRKMVGFFREPQNSISRRCGLDHKSFLKWGREANASTTDGYDLGQALMKESLDQLSWFHLRMMNALIANKDYVLHHAFSSRNVNMFFAGDVESKNLNHLRLVTAPYDFDLSQFVDPTGAASSKEREQILLSVLDEVLRINENLNGYWIKKTIQIEESKLRTSIQRVISAIPDMMVSIKASRTDQKFKDNVIEMLTLFLERLKDSKTQS
ncbi:MAG: hypothetical protein JNM39_19005 [Bdellovibrionaceae bacterium]|nr:hypothetical protein [Pseudobdellovibrionaceae bacterium]